MLRRVRLDGFDAGGFDTGGDAKANGVLLEVTTLPTSYVPRWKEDRRGLETDHQPRNTHIEANNNDRASPT
jgi:hypothetical protein